MAFRRPRFQIHPQQRSRLTMDAKSIALLTQDDRKEETYQ